MPGRVHVSCFMEKHPRAPGMEAEMLLTKIAKMAAYTKAPRATFAVMHPLKAAKFGAIYLIVKSVTRR